MNYCSQAGKVQIPITILPIHPLGFGVGFLSPLTGQYVRPFPRFAKVNLSFQASGVLR